MADTIPIKLSATNQGRAGFAVAVKLALIETAPGQWRPEVREKESGLPLLFTGHEVTQFQVISQDERRIVAFGLEGVETEIIPLEVKDDGEDVQRDGHGRG